MFILCFEVNFGMSLRWWIYGEHPISDFGKGWDFWGSSIFLERGGGRQLLQPNFHLKYFDPCFTTSGPNGPRSPVLSSLMSDMQVVFQIHLHNNKIHIWSWYKLCIYQAFFQKLLSTPILPRGGEVWTVSGSIANDDCVVLSLPLCCGLCLTYQSSIFEGNGKCDGDVQQGQGGPGRQ